MDAIDMLALLTSWQGAVGGLLAVCLALPLRLAVIRLVAVLLKDPAQRGPERERGWRAVIDPLGLALLAVVPPGWAFGAAPMLSDRFATSRRRAAVALASGPCVLGALCVGATAVAVHRSGSLGAAASAAALVLIGLTVVSLLPVPPCDLGRIILLLGPRSPGWQQARVRLDHENVGTVIVAAILLLPYVGFPLNLVGSLSSPLRRGLVHLVGGA